MLTKRDIAISLATAIKQEIKERGKGNISPASISTSYALHIALEAIAKDLEVDVKWFKIQCGIGQPLAYFI